MTCANPRYPNCKHPEAAHIPGGCDQCVIAETCDMYVAPESQPPCYVQSWAKAHNGQLVRERASGDWICWVRDAAFTTGKPTDVPDHASDAWLAGMVRIVCNVEPWISDTSWRVAFVAICTKQTKPTLHAALCRAVTPDMIHTC